MPPCKGHRKSRNGCQVCKRRRIKCDETRPECRNCSRHGSSCVYSNNSEDHDDSPRADPQSSSLIVSSNTLETPSSCQTCGFIHTHTTRFPWPTEFPGALPACTIPGLLRIPASNSPSSSLSPSDSTLSTIDLSLLHHFTISTSQTFSPLPEIRDLWSHVVPGPQIGARWSFVLHACLAAARAHLHSSNSNPQGLAMAEHHYSVTITLMKEEIGQISNANCHALFVAACACNIFLLSRRPREFSSSSQAVVTRGSEAAVGLDTSWTLLTRGTFGILHQSWPWILKGPVSSMFRPYPEPSLSATRKLTKNTEEMLKKMNNLAAEWGFGLEGAEEELGDVQTATAYFIAVWNLRRIWVVLEFCLGASKSKFDSPITATIDEPESDTAFERELPRKRREIYRPDSLSSSIFQFAIRTPPRFWECLEKRRPRALIIYAYFSVCWEAFNYGSSSSGNSASSNMWWVKGRAEMDLNAVEGELFRLDTTGESWKEWIEGARRCYNGLKQGWWLDEEENRLISTDSVPDDLASSRGIQLRTGNQFGSQGTQQEPIDFSNEPFGFTFDMIMGHSLTPGDYYEGWSNDSLGTNLRLGVDIESMPELLDESTFTWDGTAWQ